MPFESKAQRRFMHARHPEIAKRWEHTYGAIANLPERAASGRRGKRRRKVSRARS